MRIAVAADGPGLDNMVEPVLARADWFVMVDEPGRVADAVENPYRDDREKCGENVAALLHAHGVEVVLSGNRGPKAALACQRLGVRTAFMGRSRVGEAVASYREMETALRAL